MKTLKYILSLGIAATAGWAIGWLSAPASGRETRSRFADELDNTRNNLKEYSKSKIKKADRALNENLKEQRKKSNASLNSLRKAIID